MGFFPSHNPTPRKKRDRSLLFVDVSTNALKLRFNYGVSCFLYSRVTLLSLLRVTLALPSQSLVFL